MSVPTEIVVCLLDEGVDGRRPGQTERLHGNVFRIVDQPYDRYVQIWEFEPADEVVYELIESSEGRILATTRRAP